MLSRRDKCTMYFILPIVEGARIKDSKKFLVRMPEEMGEETHGSASVRRRSEDAVPGRGSALQHFLGLSHAAKS